MQVGTTRSIVLAGIVTKLFVTPWIVIYFVVRKTPVGAMVGAGGSAVLGEIFRV